jgi:CBS-domain-containing membrane protein
VKTDSTTLPARLPVLKIVYGWLGSVLAIGLVGALTDSEHLPLVLGSFGASCVLVYGFPELPFSQPRHVFLGHLLSSAIGLAGLTMFGPWPASMALATATAVAAMMALRCVHPPAGSNPVIVYLTQPGWTFLAWPTALGALLLLAVALLFNNLGRERRYPQYW